jgi:hypothetical protein
LGVEDGETLGVLSIIEVPRSPPLGRLCHRVIGLPVYLRLTPGTYTFNAYYMSIYPFNWVGLLHITCTSKIEPGMRR